MRFMSIPRLMLLCICCCLASLAHADAVSSFSRTLSVDGTDYKVRGVVIDLHNTSISMKVGLADGRIGQTESLGGIAQRYGAVAAINGTFFDAYTKETLKNPDMALLTNGHFIFRSDLGTLLGFERDNTPHMGQVNVRLLGTLRQNGKVQSWYAYYINRVPSSASCITLFTHAWGEQVAPMGGSFVVVDHGKVSGFSDEAVTIPQDGYVIHFRGEGAQRALFRLGQQVDLTPQINAPEQGADTWKRVKEALGAGPRVLAQGVPVFDPSAEGFSDPKILERAGARSAAGYTADGKLFLITVSAVRVSALGPILKALGCVEGMNLDGGTSSGLWYRGKYLTTPGRQISNALLVLQ